MITNAGRAAFLRGGWSEGRNNGAGVNCKLHLHTGAPPSAANRVYSDAQGIDFIETNAANPERFYNNSNWSFPALGAAATITHVSLWFPGEAEPWWWAQLPTAVTFASGERPTFGAGQIEFGAADGTNMGPISQAWDLGGVLGANRVFPIRVHLYGATVRSGFQIGDRYPIAGPGYAPVTVPNADWTVPSDGTAARNAKPIVFGPATGDWDPPTHVVISNTSPITMGDQVFAVAPLANSVLRPRNGHAPTFDPGALTVAVR